MRPRPSHRGLARAWDFRNEAARKTSWPGDQQRLNLVGELFGQMRVGFLLPIHLALAIWVRMIVFLHPEMDPKGAGFHINQSLIAVGTGGWTGRGYMEGVQKLFYLPESATDFIFANIAEELGFIGAVLILVLFVILGLRGMRTVFLLRDPFARLLAFGITVTILIQAFFNMSVVVALLPTKGITLPFVSSGGTSLCIMLASIGVLLNLTREID